MNLVMKLKKKSEIGHLSEGKLLAEQVDLSFV